MQKALCTAAFLAISTLAAAHAQETIAPGDAANASTATSQGAPIVRAYADTTSSGERQSSGRVFDTQPSSGIFVRSEAANGVEVVNSSNGVTELRVLQGRTDVTVHHPADHSEILVDLPGGQVAILKDGLYTFNAGTRTVRVLHGEAEAYGGVKSTSKGTKVKESQQLTFSNDMKLKAVNSYAFELAADLLPGQGRGEGFGEGRGFYGGYPYFAGAYGYPFGYGFAPYGYGYPFGVGLGIGYYGGGFGGFGGFHGGGFRR